MTPTSTYNSRTQNIFPIITADNSEASKITKRQDDYRSFVGRAHGQPKGNTHRHTHIHTSYMVISWKEQMESQTDKNTKFLKLLSWTKHTESQPDKGTDSL